MDIFSPKNKDMMIFRNTLLSKCLRQNPYPFDIQEEYPIVLSSDGYIHSYCVKIGNDLVAHANLWPREIVYPNQNFYMKVALIGNVATHPRYRSRGIMKHLLNEIEKIAIESSIKSLILWSDLDSFYHKFGYLKMGSEFRYVFTFDSGIKLNHDLVCVDPRSLTSDDLQVISDLRLEVPLTLRRSTCEFRRLLTIPAMGLFLIVCRSEIVAFMILGKGADMVGVIHEWGGDLDLLVAGFHSIMSMLEISQVTVLAPFSNKVFDRLCSSKSSHHMALCKKLQTTSDLSELFIWGLDSI